MVRMPTFGNFISIIGGSGPMSNDVYDMRVTSKVEAMYQAIHQYENLRIKETAPLNMPTLRLTPKSAIFNMTIPPTSNFELFKTCALNNATTRGLKLRLKPSTNGIDFIYS